MLRKKSIFCGVFTILFAVSLPVFAQKLKTEANGYHDKKEHCKAVETYEKSIAAGESQDNYSYYAAAQSACQCGNQTEKAIDFYKRGFKIAIDWSNYEFFANDTLNGCFNQTTEWKNILVEMKNSRDAYEIKLKAHLADLDDSTKKITKSPLTDKTYLDKLARKDFKSLLKAISEFNEYPNAPLTNRWMIYNYKVSETLEIPYLVYVPQNYNPKQKTPLYVFLHGAAQRNSFALKNISLLKDEAVFFEQPIKQNAFIIYPMANKDFNWLYHQKAFEAIIGEIRQVKSLYNIDDNRIYLTGHSNGGSGSFWFAVNMPTEFASFSAFNFGPMSYNGNTHFGNLRNEYTFLGISGTDDFIFDYKQISELQTALGKEGVHWANYGLKGTHGLPYNSPSEVAFLYDNLQKQRRNPAPSKLQWETDKVENGRIFWLEITKLDTDKPKESWHIQTEPRSTRIFKEGMSKNPITDFYPNKSGAIMASIENNVVKIKASCVKELTFYVLPQLVDLKKPLKIYVNDKLLFNAKVKPDKNVLLEEFNKTKDRSLLVVNKITIEVEK